MMFRKKRDLETLVKDRFVFTKNNYRYELDRYLNARLYGMEILELERPHCLPRGEYSARHVTDQPQYRSLALADPNVQYSNKIMEKIVEC